MTKGRCGRGPGQGKEGTTITKGALVLLSNRSRDEKVGKNPGIQALKGERERGVPPTKVDDEWRETPPATSLLVLPVGNLAVNQFRYFPFVASAYLFAPQFPWKLQHPKRPKNAPQTNMWQGRQASSSVSGAAAWLETRPTGGKRGRDGCVGNVGESQ